MDIVIHLDQREPPSGTISLQPGESVPESAERAQEFAGWLAMVGALYELLGREERGPGEREGMLPGV